MRFNFPFVLLNFACLARSAVVDLPAAIIGTYNVSFVLTAVPTALASSLIPDQYTILPPNTTAFPGIGSDLVPIFIELGREANAGPPLLNFENFQEAKLEIPNVQRLSNSTSPFLYKRWIAVDDVLDVVGSLLEFGLNTTLETFAPQNSSNATSHDYSVVGAIDANLTTIEGEPVWPLSTFESIGGLPWFADYLTCAQHFYNWTTSEVTYLSGSVTLHPPFTGDSAVPLTFPAQAIHGVFPFKIVGLLPCEVFV